MNVNTTDLSTSSAYRCSDPHMGQLGMLMCSVLVSTTPVGRNTETQPNRVQGYTQSHKIAKSNVGRQSVRDIGHKTSLERLVHRGCVVEYLKLQGQQRCRPTLLSFASIAFMG